MKRLKNIEDKNEELPKALSSANKVSNGAKNGSDLIIILSMLFTSLTETLKNLK